MEDNTLPLLLVLAEGREEGSLEGGVLGGGMGGEEGVKTIVMKPLTEVSCANIVAKVTIFSDFCDF